MRQQWSAVGGLVEVKADLVARVLDLGGEVVSQDEATVVAAFGSRLAFRLWGMFGRDSFPFRLTLALTASGATVAVSAVGEDDEGWYLFRTSQAERIFKERFNAVCRTMAA